MNAATLMIWTKSKAKERERAWWQCSNLVIWSKREKVVLYDQAQAQEKERESVVAAVLVKTKTFQASSGALYLPRQTNKQTILNFQCVQFHTYIVGRNDLWKYTERIHVPRSPCSLCWHESTRLPLPIFQHYKRCNCPSCDSGIAKVNVKPSLCQCFNTAIANVSLRANVVNVNLAKGLSSVVTCQI